MIEQKNVKGFPVNFWDDWSDETQGVSIWNREGNETVMFLSVPNWRALEKSDEDYINECLRQIPKEIFWDVIDDIIRHIDECKTCILDVMDGSITITEDQD